MTDLSTKFAVICDDVRREDSGKLIAIGIYGGDIRVNAYPATLAFSILIFAECTKAGDVKISIRSKLNGAVTSERSGSMKIENAGAVTVNSTGFAVPNIDGDGVVSFDWRVNENEWEEVASMPIALAPPTS